MANVAGLPPDQVELLRSQPSWAARVAAAGTIPREEAANRVYRFDPERFAGVDVPTLFLLGGDSAEPFRRGAEAVTAALPNCRLVEMPGQRHAAMDTGTEVFLGEVLAFLEAA
jgi:pimeloyl-ACP methyl ester carboxylesterase